MHHQPLCNVCVYSGVGTRGVLGGPKAPKFFKERLSPHCITRYTLVCKKFSNLAHFYIQVNYKLSTVPKSLDMAFPWF